MILCTNCEHYTPPPSPYLPAYCGLVLPPMLAYVGSNMIPAYQHGCSLGTPRKPTT